MLGLASVHDVEYLQFFQLFFNHHYCYPIGLLLKDALLYCSQVAGVIRVAAITFHQSQWNMAFFWEKQFPSPIFNQQLGLLQFLHS